ncbi:hypothetical protein BBO99_00003166 [Phytophthora kernoviae]|uniref:Aminotransferase class I/classII large domain-containing protein n=1 Tax=Phytophthora kernoviae TaxID=325452 RepID=A0A421GUV2_9STRA|nr:hypothetical protein BBO99_00003166 [Phytophthora kernoviae]
METPSAPLQSKGPRKVINCKIRMLCTAAGSALDELSNKMIQEGKAIYKLGLGQSPFPIPQCIVDELRANSHQRDYLPVAGLPELCEDIAAWGAERLHINYSLDDVLVGPGTKELLFVLQTVYYGDLLLPNPSCTSYAPQANIAGRNMMWLPTHAEDHFVLRPEVLEAHCVKDPDAPRILILNSPSNPTGCAYQADELQKMDIEVQVPQGGFYLFPCFRRHRKALALRGVATDEQLCAHLLQDTGVAILPGSCFGRAPEELFARLAFVDFKGEIALYLIESMVSLATKTKPDTW